MTGDELDRITTTIEKALDGRHLTEDEVLLVKSFLPRLTQLSSHWARRCSACGGTSTEPYMVHNHVWSAVMPDRAGYLHLRCLETRLQRRLTREDFVLDSPLNTTLLFGFERAA